MITLLTSLFKSSTAIFTFLGAAFTAIVYFFGKSKAREEVKVKILQENIQHVTKQSQKVATIQQKQVKIASEPTPDRDAIHEQLLKLANRDKKQ